MRLVRLLCLSYSICFLSTGCSPHNLSLISFRHEFRYQLPIPGKFTATRARANNAERMEALSIAHFKDGSLIFITDDEHDGLVGGFENFKIEKYGKNYRLNYYLMNDTVTLAGVRDGKYWREKKYYDVIAGYYDANLAEKIEYDKIVDSIIPQVEEYKRQLKSRLNEE